MRPTRPCFRTVFSLLVVLCSTGSLPALGQPVSPSDGGPLPEHALRLLRDDPTAFRFGHAWIEQTRRARENRRLAELGLLKAAPEELAKMVAVSGARKVPVFLAKYSDTGADPFPAGDLQTELFDGPWPTGTMSEYYKEISYGMLSLDGTVFDWITLPQDDDYYAGTVNGLDPAASKVGEFIHDTLDAWDGTVNFADFDNDGPDGIPNSGDDDGFVDFIGLVHPEIGGECSGTPANNIWSHRWRLSNWDAGIYTTNDNAAGGGKIKIEDYTIMPAQSCSGTMIEIGVFCHEFGHAFGLPDLYDTDASDGDSEGIGFWGLMGAGNWNDPDTPAHMSAWSKAELGWINPAVVSSDLNNWPISSATLSPTAFKMWKNGTPGSEYFLVEYRTADKFDASIEKPGVLVWHVDEGNANNKDERNKMIDLECADQTGADHTTDADDLDSNANRGDANDPFCDGQSFAPTTNPSSVANNGVATNVVVTNIRNCGASGELVADLIVGKPQGGADLCMRDCGADACTEPSTCTKFWASPEIYIDNNEDGVIDPPAEGIANKLFARVRNFGTDDAASVDVDFYYADPAMGLLFPSTGTSIGSDNISLIAKGGAETAMVEWTIPLPPPTIGHYCVGVIATNSQDGQSSERAPEDNNVAQINIQELYAKAGSALPPQPARDVDSSGAIAWNLAAAAPVDPPFVFTQTVKLCNVQRKANCNQFVVKVGSPPNFDDVLVRGDWSWSLSADVVTLEFGQCVDLVVKAVDNTPFHLDRLELPLTLMCGNEAVGGTVLTFNIDNVPPSPPCAWDIRRTTPPDTDNAPGDKALQLRWRDDFFDVLGFPERIERWRVYTGFSNGFPIGTAPLLVETCIDEDPRSTVYDHFADVDPLEEKLWYALVAVDRAGNESEACYSQVNRIQTDSPASARGARLEQNAPNPFNPTTQIAFELGAAADVRLSVFDMQGRFVRSLVEGRRDAGTHRVLWDGRDVGGREVSSGVYYYRLRVDGQDVASRRMVMVK